MITFDRIDALTASLEERLERFYSKTLADSARSLASLLRAKSALNSSLFRASELAYAEALYDDLVKRIAKLSGYTEKELRTIFKKAGFESIRDEQAIIGKLGLEVPELAESKQLTGIVNSVFARTNVVLQNLTRSIAYQSELQFIAAADDAYLAVSTGTLGIDQAIKQGVLTLAEQGVRVLNSQTGRVEQADVAIKRNIWTGINQATGDMTLAMAAEAGTDLVEVSAHPGARNKGTGPMNHASWQGKVYSISGTHPKYEPLIETTGYGTGPGLLGWNCRHSVFLYFENFEKPTYTQAELDRVNNTQVTYGGKQMDLYEATQQQRYLERGVRDWKRRQAMFEAAGLGEEHAMAGVKIQDWQAKLRDFTKQTGLERRYEWEQVAGVKAQRPAWGKTVEAKAARAPVVSRAELTEREKQSIHEWGVSGKNMRNVQSGNTAGMTVQEIEAAENSLKYFDSAIEKLPKYEGEIYRGLHNVPDDVVDNWSKNTIIELTNHQSATYLGRVGLDFTGTAGMAGNQSVMWIAKQSSGVDLKGLTNVTYGGKTVNESEILMTKGSKYKITKKEFWVKDELWDDAKIDWYFEGTEYSHVKLPDGFRLDHEFRGYYKIFLEELK